MNEYRFTKQPLVVGQLRVKTWRYVLPPDTPELAAEWGRRAAAYWQLQAETYGFKAEFQGIHIDPELCTVQSAVRVIGILDGRRSLSFTTQQVKRAQSAA